MNRTFRGRARPPRPETWHGPRRGRRCSSASPRASPSTSISFSYEPPPSVLADAAPPVLHGCRRTEQESGAFVLTVCASMSRNSGQAERRLRLRSLGVGGAKSVSKFAEARRVVLLGLIEMAARGCTGPRPSLPGSHSFTISKAFVDRSLCSSRSPSSLRRCASRRKPHDLHHPIPGLSQHSDDLFEAPGRRRRLRSHTTAPPRRSSPSIALRLAERDRSASRVELARSLVVAAHEHANGPARRGGRSGRRHPLPCAPPRGPPRIERGLHLDRHPPTADRGPAGRRPGPAACSMSPTQLDRLVRGVDRGRTIPHALLDHPLRNRSPRASVALSCARTAAARPSVTIERADSSWPR